MPVTEGAATKVGCEKTALLGGPEASLELPALLDTGVVEEKFRDSPAELSTRSPCQMADENANGIIGRKKYLTSQISQQWQLCLTCNFGGLFRTIVTLCLYNYSFYLAVVAVSLPQQPSTGPTGTSSLTHNLRSSPAPSAPSTKVRYPTTSLSGMNLPRRPSLDRYPLQPKLGAYHSAVSPIEAPRYVTCGIYGGTGKIKR